MLFKVERCLHKEQDVFCETQMPLLDTKSKNLVVTTFSVVTLYMQFRGGGGHQLFHEKVKSKKKKKKKKKRSQRRKL